jgi:ribosome-associated protein
MIEIDDQLTLRPEEVTATASRSGGPGGQNVNKVATRVTLWFDLDGSSSLNDEQRARIRERLGGRIGKDGRLRVTSRKHRTQAANRAAAEERLGELLREALAEEAERKPTRVPKRAKRRRLTQKRRRSETKRRRGTPSLELE